MSNGAHSRDWIAIFISVLAMTATGINAWYSHNSFQLNSETQRASLRIALETQKTAIFSQFQQQYSLVFARFPKRFLDPTFRPKLGTDDYARLEAYWLFCFSEWFATNRLAPDAYGDLWRTYYSPLIMNGLGIPSLRYVLETMMTHYPLERGDYRTFFLSLSDLARKSGDPFSAEVEQRLESHK